MPDRCKGEGLKNAERLEGPTFQFHLGVWKPTIELRGIIRLSFRFVEVWRSELSYHFTWNWMFPNVESTGPYPYDLVPLKNSVEVDRAFLKGARSPGYDVLIDAPIEQAFEHERFEGLLVDGKYVNDPHPEETDGAKSKVP